MSRATCRCGQALEIPAGGVDHVKCPKCSARVRIVRKKAGAGAGDPIGDGDGFLRFSCPCGRKLKVDARERPTHGKCPECGRIVPVPTSSSSSGLDESPTEELASSDVAMLQDWAAKFPGAVKPKSVHGGNPGSTITMSPDLRNRPAEAGLRVCPNCGRPVHLGSETCRGCGTAVPRR